jgi:hypothetical protein
MFTLLLATPSLSLIGAIGASLIVGIKNSEAKIRIGIYRGNINKDTGVRVFVK